MSYRLAADDQDHAIATYRYLRLSIVIVILTLLVSLLIERANASCWQGSVSSYYYTPVHSIFVAALAVIGIALIAIRGATVHEEVLLNMAGFLAPIVAFVPTGWSSTDCPSNLNTASKQAVDGLLSGNQFFARFSSNNLLAFIIGLLAAVLITSFVAKRARKRDPLVTATEVVVPAIGIGSVILGGILWRVSSPATFDTHAHSYSAIIMFLLVGIVMFSTARRNESKFYRVVYYACPGTMLVGGVVVFIVGRIVAWRQQILVLEGIEAAAFVVFWFSQTIELWDYGVHKSDTQQAGSLPVSSYSWARATGGALTQPEWRLVGSNVYRQYARALGGLAALPFRHRDALDPFPDPPVTTLTHEAEKAAKGQKSPLYRHSYRTWLLAYLLAKHDGHDLTEPFLESLCVVSLLHDFGLAAAQKDEDFTIRSAEKVLEVCRLANVPVKRGLQLADSVVAHATPGLQAGADAVGFYVQGGSMADLTGLRVGDLPRGALKEAYRKFPSDDVHKFCAGLIRKEAQSVPDGRFDVLARNGMAVFVRISPTQWYP